VAVNNLKAFTERSKDPHDRKKLDVLTIFDGAYGRCTYLTFGSYPLLRPAQRFALGANGLT
jgi:hypothetical protein